MGVIQIKEALLCELLGLGGDGTDEVGAKELIDIIDIKLEQMFRECIIRRKNILLTPETELKKLAESNADWRKRAKQFKSETVVFDRKEQSGIPRTLLNELNQLPETLCQDCDELHAIVLAQAPQLHFKQQRNGSVHMHVWMRLILLPEIPPELD